ncbi:oligosaccharide flippase family protein [Clostridium cadaveris]|uniref:lipopolysaccharide biosynthesis protein n=1 Tax=Clostridium cadaveris TaxID=1529 RepID=UPI0014596362|nr:oligosaccharide flippase family protein [Clostridium cadaveris]NME63975.1 oligosaccharide flippase family protein [Clostridium cadaveris]
MSREGSLVKNTLIILFGTLLPKLSGMIVLPVITGYLSKSELGTYDLITTLVSLLLPIITLQIQSAAFRFLIDCRNDNEDTCEIITNILTFITIVSLFAVIIMTIVMKKFDLLTRSLICIYFYVDMLLNAVQQIVRGLSKNKLYSISAVITSLFNMIIVLFMLIEMKAGLKGVLIAIIIATITAIFFIAVKINIFSYFNFKYLSINRLKTMLKYSWPMIPNSLSNWIMNLSDRLVIMQVLGVQVNAIYAVANKLPNVFSSVQGTFVLAWQENASIASKDSDIDEYYSNMFDSVFSILFAIMACLIAMTPILFKLLIRGDYIESYYQIPILYMGMLFSAISSFMGGIYIAHKRTKDVGITTTIAAAINLIVDILLINIIGLYAASISTLVSYFVLAIYRMYDVQKFQRVYYRKKKMIIMCCLLITMCYLCFINKFILNIFNLILAISLSILYNKKIILIVFRKVYLKVI